MSISNNKNSTQKYQTILSGLTTFQHNYAAQISTFIALCILCAVLGLLTPHFLTADNLISVLMQSTLVLILAVAETFIIISGGIDLSVGAIVAFSSACMGALVVNLGIDPLSGILLALLIGLVTGYIQGLLIAKLNMPPFIVTLGTMTIWRGAAMQFTNGQNIYGLPDALTWLGQANIGPLPAAVILTVIIYIIGWFLLSHTKFGVSIYAIGGNQNAARLSGININRVKILIYTLGGFLSAIAGIIVSGRMNGTSALVANGYELDAIAAVAIGGASMAGGVGNIWGTLIGAIMMQVIRNGMNLLNISPYYQMVVLGAVIVAAVALDCIRRREK